ncbi:MAG: LAGLIDADG family homing endonuclease [bacterium]
MGELNPYYVSGFCDGEASFVIAKNGGQHVPFFALKLRIDEKPLLDSIMAFFGCGRIYTYGHNPKAKHYSAKRRPVCFYKVTKLLDLEDNIVSHFSRYPLAGKKAQAFAEWKKLVRMAIEGVHLEGGAIYKAQVDLLRRLYQ